jgi:PAS domain S-box-containing protein
LNPIEWLFGAASFIPHGVCLAWRRDLVALHAASDLIIAAAYFAIPVVIARFVSLRGDLTQGHQRIAWLFAAFITLCGLTHVAGLVTLWAPLYGAQALIKAATALVSIFTAFALLPLLPQIINLPSPARLKAEVEAHKMTMAELETVKAQLEAQVAERTRELSVLNRRFETALSGSPIAVFEQDSDLRYTWVYNPQLGLSAEDLLGRSDEEVFAGDASPFAAPKRAALEQGAPMRVETPIPVPGGEPLWFDLKTRPVELPDGRPGLISTAADITPQKRQQAELAILMRELNHRSKNLLAIVQSIARQTAAGLAVPAEYLDRLGARLRSLAEAHDALVARQWRGAAVDELVRGQLRHLVGDGDERVRMTGNPVELKPEQASYVALALHELGANAAKYGALSTDAGRVDIDWRVEPNADGESRFMLEWRESGGPTVATPERRGFGRQILELLTPRALGGEASCGFPPDGMRWNLSIPA